MSTTTNFVFKALLIIAWLIFVGLSIEAGGLLVNFFFTLYNPEFLQNLYQKLDLSEMYNTHRFSFFNVYSFILIIAILKALLFYTVVMLMHRLDLKKPFSIFVSRQINQLSYFTLSIGLLSHIAGLYHQNLINQRIASANLNSFWEDSEAFILMGAVIYIIATIFKTGVALQNENDLTV